MASSSWEDQFTCKWTQEGQLDIKGFHTDMPKCLQFYLISVSRANKWPRALQLIQEEEGHCFISGTGVSFPLDYESSSSEEDQPSRGPLPEDEVEFFSGTFSKDRVKKSVFLRTVEKCVVERRKICGPLDGEDQFLNHVRRATKPRYATDQVLVPLGSLGIKRSTSVDSQTGLLTPPKQSSTSHRFLSSLDLACTCIHEDSDFTDWITNPDTKHLVVRLRRQTDMYKDMYKSMEAKCEITEHQVELQKDMVRSLQKEVSRLTQEQETAQRVLLGYKREVEELTAQNTNIKEATDDLHFQKAITVEEEQKVRKPAWEEEHTETKRPATSISESGAETTIKEEFGTPRPIFLTFSSGDTTQKKIEEAPEEKTEEITRAEITGDYDARHSSKTMADENDIDGVIDLTFRAQGSLSQNIGKLQQLIVHSGEFKKAAKYFDKEPQWSSEEGRNFMEMMEHIKHACDRHCQLLTDVQEDDLEPDDIEEIYGRGPARRIPKGLMRLRDAQTKAAGGTVRGRENAAEANTHVGYGVLGTIGAVGATVVTLGAAAPLVLVSLGYTWKSMIDGEKCKEWERAFNIVLCRLDELYSVLDAITNECTNVLDQLSHDSKAIMDKSARMTERKKAVTSKFLKKKCTRLVEDSGKLERACIEYIRADDGIRGMAGAMDRLSLE
ncbi:DnaJ (Hsp40), sub A, member 4 [Branchiostoma belcheri]|nr:DnaJ (Hsp40), sub A, member 4 [Branchiostoma belcheri]